MSINQELADQEIASRTSLIVYLRNVNNDQFKLRRFGDIVYFSKKLHYLILYVNQAEAEETASKLRTFSFPKMMPWTWTTRRLSSRSVTWPRRPKRS